MRLLLFLPILLLPLAAHAATPEQTRMLFKELSTLAEQGNLGEANQQLAQLQDYPLYPYLIATNLAARLQQHPTPALGAAIAAFLRAHPELPPADNLRTQWLRSLGQRARWDALLTRVTDDDGTTLQCMATTAAIRTQALSHEQLVRKGLEFWRRGWSQPKACNPVFAWLEKNGELSNARIIERARLAVLSSNYGLAEYLAGKLPKPARAPIQRWLDVSRNPGNLHVIQQLPDSIAVHTLQHLAHLDLDGAAALIPKLAERLDLGANAVYEMQRYVSLLYAQNHRPEAIQSFAKLDASRLDDFARSWQARAAIQQRQWQLLLADIEAMPAAQANDNEWRYWRGRALVALGEQQAGQKIWRDLAQKRAFYGYLAADRLGLDYRLDPNPLSIDPDTRTILASMPGLRRARELLALDRRTDARREWYWAIDDMSVSQLRQAALLARDWDWYPMAIITLARSDYWDDLTIRYPLHYQQQAIRAAARNNLSPAYVLAIMRTESLFMPAIHSGAGAIGLMQLMPATARGVAADIGLARPTTSALETPALNIRLGTHYLRAMLDHFDGHLALATGAYNAGPNAIERWLPETTTPVDIWIANIPYTQTRHYVERVMKHMTAFQARMGRDVTRLLDRLAPIPPANTFDF